MENLSLKAILENAVKERETFIEKYPHIATFQTMIDSHLKDQTEMNDRFIGLFKAANTYKEKINFKPYQVQAAE